MFDSAEEAYAYVTNQMPGFLVRKMWQTSACHIEVIGKSPVKEPKLKEPPQKVADAAAKIESMKSKGPPARLKDMGVTTAQKSLMQGGLL